jgi:hypothetical protein
MASVPNMTSPLSENAKNVIRPIQYRDLEAIEQLATGATDADSNSCSVDLHSAITAGSTLVLAAEVFELVPQSLPVCSFVFMLLKLSNRFAGLIKISPFNRTRSTWRVEQVLVDAAAKPSKNPSATGRYWLRAIALLLRDHLGGANLVTGSQYPSQDDTGALSAKRISASSATDLLGDRTRTARKTRSSRARFT